MSESEDKDEEATRVDLPRTVLRVRVRRRPKALESTLHDRRGPRAGSTAPPVGRVPPCPLDQISSLRLRIQEAIVCFHHRMRVQDLPADAHPLVSDVAVAWIRSDDSVQKVARMGRNVVCISGTASRSGARLALGVEGQIFTVVLEAGDTPKQSARKIIARLGNAWTIAVRPRSDGGVSLSLARQGL